VARNIAVYREELARVHGEDARGHVVLMLHTMLGTDRDRVRELVREPMGNYLRSSMDLVVRTASTALPPGVDLNKLPDRDKEFLVRHAFERYFTHSGLFGTVDDGVEMVDRLRAIGVDEVACLIDFGVPHDEVLGSLRYIAELRDAVNS
jgi:hypothetical protein